MPLTSISEVAFWGDEHDYYTPFDTPCQACYINSMPADAIATLSALLDEGFRPEGLDQVHDTLRLVGLVLGQMALLEIITDREAEDSDRVAAARLLLSVKEAPESIAERLHKSAFSRLNTEELSSMIQRVKKGETNLKELIQSK